MRQVLGALGFVLLAVAAPSEAKTVCTVVADVLDGGLALEEGDCRSRVTPASTFKIPLAVIGFDSGFLADARHPSLPFRDGYADWGGEEWKQPTDPERWMKFSVVWFSQQIAQSLGREKFADYVRKLDYGNADISGDKGKDNGLERSWISSSLTISPVEQVGFLTRMLKRELPVSAVAVDEAMQIVERAPAPDGWSIQGKTGGAYPRRKDGSFDRAHGWGWYVGWAAKGGRTYAFARLAQDEKRTSGSPGIRAKAEFLKDLPAVLRRLENE